MSSAAAAAAAPSPRPRPRPPYDPELLPYLAAVPFPQPITLDLVLATRGATAGLLNLPGIDEIIGARPISHIERRIPGLEPGDPQVLVSIFQSSATGKAPRENSHEKKPCIIWIHGGGMVLGDRFTGIGLPLRWIVDDETDAAKGNNDDGGVVDPVVISVDYRLAPEHPYPAGVNDCYAVLRWAAEQASSSSGELDAVIDPDRIMVAGQSGGGGVAAGVCLKARDDGRNGLTSFKVYAQFLSCPMLDHRSSSVSCEQYAEGGTWSRESNRMAWEAVLGSNGSRENGKASSPATAEDLSDLPTTFIDVGSAEIFRDECVEYASRMWAAGSQAELHVYAGGFHGADTFAPASRVGRLTTSTQTAWVKRVLTSRPAVGSGGGEEAKPVPMPKDADIPAPGEAIGGL